MKRKLLVTLLFFGVFLVWGCKTIPEFKNPELAGDLFYPSSIDFGFGAAVVYDTRDTNDDDVSGFLVNIKGYPWGKWYVRPNDEARIKEYNESVSKPEDPNKQKFAKTIEKGKAYLTPRDPKDAWWMPYARRVSVYYGVSNDNFTGGGLDSDVQSFGLAFDFTPEISFHIGWAIYDVTETTGSVSVTDTDSSLQLGVSINLGQTLRDAFVK